VVDATDKIKHAGDGLVGKVQNGKSPIAKVKDGGDKAKPNAN